VTNAGRSAARRARHHRPLPFPLSSQRTLATRTTSLALQRGVIDVGVAIDPPEGRALAHAPPDFAVTHACFSIERKTHEDKGKVVVATHYKNACAIVEPADYTTFRAAVQKAIANGQEYVTFAAKKKR